MTARDDQIRLAKSGLVRWEGSSSKGRPLIAYARCASDALLLLRRYGVEEVRQVGGHEQEGRLVVDGAPPRETRG